MFLHHTLDLAEDRPSKFDCGYPALVPSRPLSYFLPRPCPTCYLTHPRPFERTLGSSVCIARNLTSTLTELQPNPLHLFEL
jgi:hypothetical protein